MRFVVLGLCIRAFAVSGRSARAGNLLISADEAALPPTRQKFRHCARLSSISPTASAVMLSLSASKKPPARLHW